MQYYSDTLLQYFRIPASIRALHYYSITVFQPVIELYTITVTVFQPVLQYYSITLVQYYRIPARNAVLQRYTITVFSVFQPVLQHYTITLLQYYRIPAQQKGGTNKPIFDHRTQSAQTARISRTSLGSTTFWARGPWSLGWPRFSGLGQLVLFGLLEAFIHFCFFAASGPLMDTSWTSVAHVTLHSRVQACLFDWRLAPRNCQCDYFFHKATSRSFLLFFQLSSDSY